MALHYLCPGCGATGTQQGRCARCRAEKERARGTRQQRGYTTQHQRLRTQAITLHPWCTQCGTTDHLTADHIVPLSRGGRTELHNLQVLCLSCNSRKRDSLRFFEGRRENPAPRFREIHVSEG